MKFLNFNVFNSNFAKFRLAHFKHSTKIVGMLVFILLVSVAHATTYYVAPNGNNNNDGSINNPWETVQHAADAARYGDIIIIKPGEYHESVLIKTSGVSFIGEERDAVIMKGEQNGNSLGSAFENKKYSNVNIEQLTIKDYLYDGIAFFKGSGTKSNISFKNLQILNNGNNGIRLEDAYKFAIDDCVVSENRGNNIFVYECSNGAITDCTANGSENGVYENEADGIVVQNSKRITIKNCVANYNGEDGIDIGGFVRSDPNYNNATVKHIRVVNCITNYNKDDGLCFSVTDETNPNEAGKFDGFDVTFANCLSMGNRNHGLTCYQEPDNVKIVNNTIINNGYGLKVVENPNNIEIKNNIISNNDISGDGINYENFIPAYRNNEGTKIYTNPDVLDISHTNWYNTLPADDYRGATVFQNEDPLVNQQTYYLEQASPCVDAGEALTQTTSSGSGFEVSVEQTSYFSDGFGFDYAADVIQIGDQQVQIDEIISNSNIRLRESISWNTGDPISFPYSGESPDLGWGDHESVNPPEEPDPETPVSDIYYVSNSGNDNNVGSESAPWKTIQHAANVAEAGATVYIKPGVYSEYVILRNSGNDEDGYISFIGEDKASVIMQGNPNLKSAFESSKSSYIKIENITIKDYHEEGIAFYKSDDFKRNIRLTNLDILNSGYERGLNCLEYTGNQNGCWDHGIRIAKVYDFIIDQCYVYNSWGNNIYVLECSRGAVVNSTANGPEDGSYRDDSDGITIQNSKRITVRNCTANFNYEDGIDIGGNAGSDIKHIRVSNCITNYNYDDGLCFSVSNGNEFDGYDVTFANCLSVGNGAHGLTCYQQPDNVKIVHNTIIDNRWGLKISDENPKNFRIKNNIISQNEDRNFSFDDINTNVFELSHTNWYGQVPPDAYRGSSFQNEDPLLRQDFELTDNSPCIDFGESLTQTTSSGSGTVVPVERVDYFNDGFDVIPGDEIQIGDRQVQIVSISPSDRTLRLSENISWNNGDPVSFVYSGNTPDLGWKESPYRNEPGTLGDVNCDGEANSIDALFILQYDVSMRTESASCPLQNPENEINLSNADVNNDGGVNAVDALLILQCDVGIANLFCENAGNRESSLNTNKRLMAFPNLFQDFITVQYESSEITNLPKMAYITNINNQIVREINIPDQTNWSTVLEVSDLTAGLYMITLIDGVSYETLKLIKN